MAGGGWVSRVPAGMGAAGGRDHCAVHRVPRSGARVPRHAGRREAGRECPRGDRRVPPRGPGRS